MAWYKIVLMQDSQNNYDFILNDQAKPPGRPGLPKLASPLYLIVIMLILIVVTAIGGTLLGGKKTKVGDLTAVLGQAQEINRVSALQLPRLTDQDVTSLAATTQNTLASDQAQIKKYATDHNIKIEAKKLATYEDKTTDESLAKAASNNYLASAYESYLHNALTDYQNALSSAFGNTTDITLKGLLQNSYKSAQLLLNSPPLKAAS